MKIDVPAGDQSVYEMSTARKSYQVRAPGGGCDCAPESSMFAFMIEGEKEFPARLCRLDRVKSFDRRPDLPMPANAHRVRRVTELMWCRPGDDPVSFRTILVE